MSGEAGGGDGLADWMGQWFDAAVAEEVARRQAETRAIVREELLAAVVTVRKNVAESLQNLQVRSGHEDDYLLQAVFARALDVALGQVVDELATADELGGQLDAAQVVAAVECVHGSRHDSSPSSVGGTPTVGEGRPGAVETAPAPGQPSGGAR